MAFTLPALPYSKDALSPHISAETLGYHYGKHHAAYVNKLNELSQGTPFAELPLEELVQRIDEAPALFNTACQHYNHSFYWNCLTPNETQPSDALAHAIDATFGSFDAFKATFTKAAAGHFGSGWAWLVKNAQGELEVVGTHDADTPLAHGSTPLLTCDVWEHAYYVDYRNARGSYIEAFWKLVNWGFVNDNFQG